MNNERILFLDLRGLLPRTDVGRTGYVCGGCYDVLRSEIAFEEAAGSSQCGKFEKKKARIPIIIGTKDGLKGGFHSK